MRPPPPYLSAVLASALLTGAAAPIVAPPQAPTTPGLKPPSAAPQSTTALPPIIPRLNPAEPNMTNIPKSYLVSGLERRGDQTFFTGPKGNIVMGPMHLQVVLCNATGDVPTRPTGTATVTISRSVQRR